MNSVFNTILARRTIYKFNTNNLIDSNLITNCLTSAIWAPNHKISEPWRFWVISKLTQKKLANIYAHNRALKRADKGSEIYQCLFDKAIIKFLKIPQIILVGQVNSTDVKLEKEDYAACSCAIQNFKLTAWENKLGVQWSTGPIINDAETYKILNIKKDEINLIAALYIGHFDEIPTSKRSSLEKVVTYL